MLMLLAYLALAAVSTGVVWKGSTILEETSGELAAYYELPAIVQGAVIAAVGSSFPELTSTVLATLLHGQFELGVAAITGSAVFNILVIPGLSALAGKNELQSNRDLVYKEAEFYMVSVAVLLLTFSFAVIYNPVAGDKLVGVLTRPLALIPVGLYLLYLFTQYLDSMDFDAPSVDKGSIRKDWLLLAASLVIITVGVEGLVKSALGLEEVLGVPSFLWGLTVIAAGTSLPDAFVSVKASEKDNADTSLANVLGSNIFDLLIAIPIGVLIAGSTTINYTRAAPMMGFLTLATVVLFTFMRTKMEIDTKEAYALLGLYGVFVLWMVLETLGITSLVL
ncbi:MAG: sodium:calcium antiporter [Candidatus Nanohaloarchaea archaeon]|nr:sodium:calcium antiporter [Candidatus Nanohaloarchaea archaeon]